MKLEKPENSNYCATVVEIKNIIPLENCNNVVATTIFGQQAIVGIGTKVGDIGIVFPAETQLSNEYCYENNIYRHSDLNFDKSQKGYMEDNRRVRAIKFRSHNSSCLFMPVTSINWALDTYEKNDLVVGQEFDKINGHEICKKYTVPVRVGRGVQQLPKKISRVDKKHMPEHDDSDNYHKWGDTIPGDKTIIVTQKIHGTSIRVGNTFVNRKLNKRDKFAKFLGVKVLEQEHDYIYGSRKVIKDINNPDQDHYYGSDIWTREGEKIKGLLPKGYLLFAELVGWIGETPIQKNYTYEAPKGHAELYVYRIAHVNEDGDLADLSWDQLIEFCNQRGLKHVPELWIGLKSDFSVEKWMNVRYKEIPELFTKAIGLSDIDTVDEGVCIRVDGIRPRILKAKCAKFFEHETALLDTGEEDLESSQSILSPYADEVVINPNTV